MHLQVLSRFRAALSEGRTTLTRLSEVSGIPIATLSDMKSSDWGERLLGRLSQLEAALDEIEAPPRSARKRCARRRDASAA